ncbi:MAG TPA: hypothetical protein PK208_03430 [Fibrobacteria bacterium]|nr:hypothetical protein [Fibrobacteria bacterium]
MRERIPLEKLLLEIVDDEFAEAPARSRQVSQDEIGEMVARKRAERKPRTGDDSES